MAGEVCDGLIGGCSAGGRRACGARPATDSGAFKNAGAKKSELSLSLSLSLNFITRVAPHCVNTLMILHAAHTPMMSAG